MTVCHACNGIAIDPLDISPCDNCLGTGSEPDFDLPDDHYDGDSCRCDHCQPF